MGTMSIKTLKTHPILGLRKNVNSFNSGWSGASVIFLHHVYKAAGQLAS